MKSKPGVLTYLKSPSPYAPIVPFPLTPLMRVRHDLRRALRIRAAMRIALLLALEIEGTATGRRCEFCRLQPATWEPQG